METNGYIERAIVWKLSSIEDGVVESGRKTVTSMKLKSSRNAHIAGKDPPAESSVRRALGNLKEKGLVREVEEPGSLNGHKQYGLTEKGCNEGEKLFDAFAVECCKLMYRYGGLWGSSPRDIEDRAKEMYD